MERDEDLLWTDQLRFNRRLRGYPGGDNREQQRRSFELRTPLAVLNAGCIPEA